MVMKRHYLRSSEVCVAACVTRIARNFINRFLGVTSYILVLISGNYFPQFMPMMCACVEVLKVRLCLSRSSS